MGIITYFELSASRQSAGFCRKEWWPMGHSLHPVEDALTFMVGAPLVVGVVGSLLIIDRVSFRQSRHPVLVATARLNRWAFSDEILATTEHHRPSPICSTVVVLWRSGLIDRSMLRDENPNTGIREHLYKINQRGLHRLGLSSSFAGRYEPLSPRGSTARRLEQVLQVLRDLGRQCTAEEIHRNVDPCSGVCRTEKLLEELVHQRLVRGHPGNPKTYKVNAWGLGWLKRNASAVEV